MSAEPSERPSNKRVDLVTEFHEEYGKAFADARVSVEHTTTEGWSRLFRGQRDEEQAMQRHLCKSLEAAASNVQLIGPTEETEKELGDIKKSMTAFREMREAFERRTIAPVKAPVEQCQRVIERFKAQARRHEQDAPLHNVGLEHLMNDAVSEVEKVAWNDETGRVEIVKAE